MTLTKLLVPTFAQMLRALSAWLDKAAAHEAAAGRTPDALLSLQLAADMYPLASQVRWACFQAQEPAYRLRGIAPPDALQQLRDGGLRAAERPGTLRDAQQWLGEAIAFLDALAANALDAGAARPIFIELPNGMTFDLSGEDYARDWSLPQFYFHLNTAYAILRHHGIALGKADYVPHMMAYLRNSAMPQE